MPLGPGTERRLAVVVGDLLGEPPEVARDVAAYFNVYLARLPALSRFGIVAIIFGVLFLPPLLVFRLTTADGLRPDVRQRYLAKWAEARSYYLREGFFLLKAIALFGWGQHPIVRERIGVGPVAALHGGAP